jgi:hypothetical protein
VSEPIWSTGGAGGERAVTEDLEWASGTLRSAARDVALASAELERRRAALELSPSVGHAGLSAELGYAAANLGRRLEDLLDDSARRLAAVASAYLEAERAARHRVGFFAALWSRAVDLAGTQAWFARASLSATLVTPMALDVPGARAVLPDGPPPTTALLGRDEFDRALSFPEYEKFAAALAGAMRALELLALEPGVYGVTAHQVEATPVRSLEDAMNAIFDTEEAGDGSVRIERWTDEDGVTRRVVFIPGTEDWLVWSGNPADIQADLSLMAGQMPEFAKVVVAALEADGARPGDPVLLAGHSLGGILATALAANPGLLRGVEVKGVVTAGSPTGRIELPKEVRALHLEGTRDIVPGLDGRPNPDTPSRITVHHDVRDSELDELAGEGETIASAHHLETYAQTARLVDEGVSPSTAAWLREQREFFEPGGDVVVTEYRPAN